MFKVFKADENRRSRIAVLVSHDGVTADTNMVAICQQEDRVVVTLPLREIMARVHCELRQMDGHWPAAR